MLETIMFMIAGGSALDGITGRQIAHATTSWTWIFWLNVILTKICRLVTTLFQAETNLDRPPEYETGDGLEISGLADIRRNGKPSWADSFMFTSWYNRSVAFALCELARH